MNVGIGYSDSSTTTMILGYSTTATASTFDYSGYIATGSNDLFAELIKELAKLELWERSRNWLKAPATIYPKTVVLGRNYIWNRRISPMEWTGKNFRKELTNA